MDEKKKAGSYDYAALADKWLEGTITGEEIILLEEWYNSGLADPVLIPEAFASSEAEHAKRLLQGIRKKIMLQSAAGQKKVHLMNRSWLRYAAAIVLVVGVAAYLRRDVKVDEKAVAISEKQEQDVNPGGDKAVLTLADGSVILLDTVKNGILAHEGSGRITKKDGQLVYNALNTGNKQIGYNTMTTPRGGQYQVILSDGTRVWLNSASSLRFPALFSGKQRAVELTGEAYFEVAANKSMPFKVSVNGMEVRVLGTHFNVMAYPDERAIRTTLLEGSVQMMNGARKAFLKPGQEASLASREAGFEVNEVNAADAIVWKNGLFQFNDKDIYTIMRQLSRWYDIRVVYTGNMTGKNFSGLISKYTPLSKVLKMLELTKELRFKIEDKIITVS